MHTLAAAEEARVHEAHHGQVTVHAHTGQEEDVGEPVDGDDVAAQFAEEVPKRPVSLLTGGEGPQWEGEDKHQVRQCQVNHKCIHQTPTPLPPAAHDHDHKDVSQGACEKHEEIKQWQVDVGMGKTGAGVVPKDRISVWHEQTNCYATEMREFKQQMVAQIETLDKETLRTDLGRVGTRVELEMDYLETQNGAQPCVDLDDKLVEQQVTVVKEKNKAKCDKATGEM
uniref:Uncharacterized protein n=1 Tax=Hucho hucho TaxID=62062 RepID=A0A4W5KVR2_9TELE